MVEVIATMMEMDVGTAPVEDMVDVMEGAAVVEVLLIAALVGEMVGVEVGASLMEVVVGDEKMELL